MKTFKFVLPFLLIILVVAFCASCDNNGNTEDTTVASDATTTLGEAGDV